jgi:hypothetical protein
MMTVNASKTVEHMNGMIDSAMETIELGEIQLTPGQTMLVRAELLNMFVAGYVRRQDEQREASKALSESISGLKSTLEELVNSTEARAGQKGS